MPNLDELSHAMEFTIGGETFIIHDVAPEVLAQWEDDEANNPVTGLKALERADEQVLAFLNGDEESVKRWKALRTRKKDIVPMWKIGEFLRELVETQTGRPTNPPSPSDAGRGKSGRTSGGK